MNKELRKKIIIFSIIGVVIIGFIVYQMIIGEDDKIIETPVNNNFYTTEIVVEIKGEVKKPNLYHMMEGDRVYDLIKIAGGYTIDADTFKINLAQKLTDEMVIYVPPIEIEEGESGKISINKAKLSDLTKLDGIGDAKAQSIIDYREKNGLFMKIEDLLNVTGISKSIFEKIKDKITV